MLDKQDIVVLRGMFGEALRANNIDLKREIRDEVHSLIAASEHRMMGAMDRIKFDIIAEFSELLDVSILPQIAELQKDMVVVKTTLKLA